MVHSRWSDAEAQEFITRYVEQHGEDLALRVYTSRLIGRDEDLVLHGGGNTSVKTTAQDLVGDSLEVLAVKGSGWDLVDLEPPGLPLVSLPPLLRLQELEAMSDEEMVNEVRRRLLDTSAPNPSVETLLHAALPHKFVDHTHADAILVLTNQPDGEAKIREALGDKVAVLPWIMPGFPLAKAVSQAYQDNPAVEGIVLLHHGIFTFGDDARTSYERMIDLVAAAESYIEGSSPAETMCSVASAEEPPELESDVARVLPVIRGALASRAPEGGFTRLQCSWRREADLLAFSRHEDCARLIATGPLTPDHVLRTKSRYLFLTPEQAADPAQCRTVLDEYQKEYLAYFEENKDRVAQKPTMLDPSPRAIVVPGLGLFGFGSSKRAAEIAGDIGEHTLRSKAQAMAIGSYTGLTDAELFEMEYWSLEQAKLGRKKPPILAGQIALVTGGAGAIGAAVSSGLARSGASVVVADLDRDAAQRVVDTIRGDVSGAAAIAVGMDVADPDSVEAGFAATILEFGGVDILVANAGIAHVSALRDMDPSAFKSVLDVNLFGTMTVLQQAARILESQGTGGSVVVQASKNVFAPGAAFGAYSASKAGQHQLGKIAAMEFASLGVRVNMINADAVFGDSVPSGLWAEVGPDRMKARGLDEQGLRNYYRERSLLKMEVTPDHVAAAVVFLASEQAAATTGTTLTVDGGVAGAFPR